MDKKKYLEDLIRALQEADKGKVYIDACTKYAERLIENKLPVIFDIKHLSLLIGMESNELSKIIFANEELFYQQKKIMKKSGGFRQLLIPSMTLKYIQRWILDNILINIRVSEHATGFCQNKSIVTNASRHVGKECIINMDIKDFFPSIAIEDIFRVFYYYGYTKELSFSLSKLCTYDGFLPQGSPASPYLSNIVCLKLDKRISKLAEKYKAEYTRYADDITVSGNYGIERCEDIIKQIISDEGFLVNEKKTRIAYKHQRQEVTGLIVNQNHIGVAKDYKRRLKQEIYYCIKFGVADHLEHIGCSKSFYKEHLYGKAYYIKMVEPVEGKKIIEMLENVEWEY